MAIVSKQYYLLLEDCLIAMYRRIARSDVTEMRPVANWEVHTKEEIRG